MWSVNSKVRSYCNQNLVFDCVACEHEECAGVWKPE